MPSAYVDGIGAPAGAQSDAITGLTGRLDRLAHEVSEVRQRSEQLRAVLEKRTHRVHQLIGERDRLTSLLAGRDAELQRLNRELGALSARGGPAQVRSFNLLAAARKLLDRLHRGRRISGRAQPAGRRPHPPDVGINEARLVPWLKHRPPIDLVAILAFGLSEAEIERVLATVEPSCAEHEIAPLLLTDNDGFELFRGRRVLFEFLPARPEQERFAPDLDWRLYTLRRLALIRRKWQPSRVVAFGRRATEVLQLWRESPFEETPIPAALNGAPAGAAGPWRPAQIQPLVER